MKKFFKIMLFIGFIIWLYLPNSEFKVYGDKNILKDIVIKIDGACEEEPMKTIFNNGVLIPFKFKDCTPLENIYISYQNKYFAEKHRDHTLFWEWDDYINHIYIDKESDGIYFQHIRLRSILYKRNSFTKIKLERLR